MYSSVGLASLARQTLQSRSTMNSNNILAKTTPVSFSHPVLSPTLVLYQYPEASDPYVCSSAPSMYFNHIQRENMLHPVKYLRSFQRTLNKKESTLTALHIPEIVLLILSHLEPSTILLVRLVSSSINTLILTHQRSISMTVAQRQFSIIITDWYPPNVDGLQKKFHLKTIARLPKAYELARRANSQLECTVDISREAVKGREYSLSRPTISYPTFIARCARAILTIWVIGDIRRHMTQPEPLPAYIPLFGRREKRVGLLTRMTYGVSRVICRPPVSSQINRQAISQCIETLAATSTSEIKSQLTIFDSARTTYLDSLSLDCRLDLVWVQDYLFAGLAITRRRYSSTSREELAFALQQSPNFLLLLSSRDPNERSWASRLVIEMIRHKESEFLTHHVKSEDEWARIMPFPPVEKDMAEEAKRVKAELTRGDWRHGNSAAWRTQ